MNTEVQPDLKQEKLGFPGIYRLPQRFQGLLASLRAIGPLRLMLALALLEGLICFIIIPPWSHNDEPGHFDYVWLAAHSPAWPVRGQYDLSMRKELAASLQQYGWYAIRNIKPDFNSTEPMWIGTSQLGDKPGYYFLASLPLRLMPNAPIIVQYFAARSVSLLLYLLIIIVIWYALGEILPAGHPLRWITTVFVALLPAFADEMASVNNDVSAVLAASLFLWASLRLIQRGISIPRLLFLVTSLVACYLSKNTAVFAFVLAPLVLILALVQGRFMALVWGAIALAVVAVAALLLKLGGPLAWYEQPAGAHQTRVQLKNTTLGSYAFQFDDSGTGKSTAIVQIVPPNQVKLLRGKTITLGCWIWSNQPTGASPMYVRFVTDSGAVVLSPHTPIRLSQIPKFSAVTFTVPEDAARAVVTIGHAQRGITNNKVYYDGLVIATGKFGSAPPSFTDANGVQGHWDGVEFTNLLRNASAEQPSYQIRSLPGSSRIMSSLTHSLHNPYLFLATIQDWKGTSWYYTGAAGVLFRTFWASLAGDKAFLRSPTVNSFLQALTVAGVLGVPVWLWKRRKNLRWDLIGFLGVALVLPWAIAVFRGASTFLSSLLVFPWARYAFPGILPTALFLCTGWLAWLEVLSSHLKLTEETTKTVFLSLMLGISAFAIMNAIQVLHQPWWYGGISLLLLFLFQYVFFILIARRQGHPDLQPPPLPDRQAP